ncbi:MAG: winged helix-turn-helix domain-containing protein [Acidobacteriota bacterium]
MFSFEGYRLQEAPLDLFYEGQRIALTPQQGNLLLLLVRQAGRVVRRDEIRRHLWGHDTHVDFDRNINVTVRELRRVLNDEAGAPVFIETVRGEGYRFVAEVESLQTATRGRRSGLLSRAVGVLSSLVLGACLTVLWRGEIKDSPPSPQPRSLSRPIDDRFAEAYLDAVLLANGQGFDNRQRSLEKLRPILESNPSFLSGHKALTKLLYDSRWDPLPAGAVFCQLESSAWSVLELDTKEPQALHALGYSAFRYRMHFAEAERFFEAALELDPAYPQAHHDYGLLLLTRERFHRANEHLQTALGLYTDPRIGRFDLAYAAFLAGQPEKVLRLLDGRATSRSLYATTLAVESWRALKDEPRALEEANAILRQYDHPAVPSVEEWYATTLEAMHHWQAQGNRWGSEIAAFEERLGHRAAALAALAEACVERSGWSLPYVGVDPRFAGLRSDPAFGRSMEACAPIVVSPSSTGSRSPGDCAEGPG